METLNIAFIGGGNMASAIIGGLVEAGVPSENISVSDPLESNLQRLNESWSVKTSSSNLDVIAGSDIVILAVKPQVLLAVCEEIRQQLAEGCLVLSIAAGLSSAKIDQALGGSRAVIRCMPNTPALVKQGASVLVANSLVSEAQKQAAESILAAVGTVSWIEDEAQMDAVTAVSGSGPAYFFLVIESMIDAGVSLGLDAELAQKLALQTALGAAQLACDSEDPVAELRRKVTSPNGTTERAIQTFESKELREIFRQAMEACALRSQELGAD